MTGIQGTIVTLVPSAIRLGLVATILAFMTFLYRLLCTSRQIVCNKLADRITPLSTNRVLHYITLPSASSSSNLLLVLIPGNPGVPAFYEPMMRQVHALAERNIEIVTLSHTGHSMPWINGNVTYDLTTQIVDKVAYLEKRLKDNPLLEVVLVGHSIGAHIALSVFSHFPHRVKKLVLMQPAVMHIRESASGKRMGPMFEYYNALSYLAAPTEYLPKRLIGAILPYFVGDDPVLQSAALSLCNRIVLRNILNMARHEMHELKDIDDQLVRTYQHKMLFVFSQEDNWVPTEFANFLQEQYTEAKATTTDLPHAFMIDKSGSEYMAQITWKWMNDLPLE